MYLTKYLDPQFADEFLSYADKNHYSDKPLIASNVKNATILPFKSRMGGGN